MTAEESFKGWWHAGVGVVIGVSAAYNAMRFCSTHCRRNAVNTILYVGLTVYEFRQAQRHWAK